MNGIQEVGGSIPLSSTNFFPSLIRPGESSRWQRVWSAVRRVPRGRVATYGQIAQLAGIPGAARQVGYALAALADVSDVPWQRVVNARGEVSERADFDGAPRQRLLLLEEGIHFDAAGKIDLVRFGWKPRQRHAGRTFARERPTAERRRSR